MNFLNLIFYIFLVYVSISCKDLSFKDEDIFSFNADSKKAKDTKSNKENIKSEDKRKTEETDLDKNLAKEFIKKDKPKFSEEERTILSEDLELSENLVIQNRKVILDMIQIQTNEHNLTIIAEEFLSNHSIIRNFPAGQTAQKTREGRSGGSIFILSNKAGGHLKLILNGENGGRVSKRKVITKEEKQELLGSNGKNGRSAVYKRLCDKQSFLFLTNKKCWWECVLKPTRAENGGDGKQGFSGEEGKNGGDTGSFHLKAFDLSEFNLTEIKKTAGLGSEGGKGSFGGFGGKAGRNGKDERGLCSSNLSRPKRGSKGQRGLAGKAGKNGVERSVCLEVLNSEDEVYTQIQNIIEAFITNTTDKFSLLHSIFQLEEMKNKEAVICQ